jgi:hypothetical protein
MTSSYASSQNKHNANTPTGLGHDLIHQITVEQARQHTDTDPVNKPPPGTRINLGHGGQPRTPADASPNPQPGNLDQNNPHYSTNNANPPFTRTRGQHN